MLECAQQLSLAKCLLQMWSRDKSIDAETPIKPVKPIMPLEKQDRNTELRRQLAESKRIMMEHEKKLALERKWMDRESRLKERELKMKVKEIEDQKKKTVANVKSVTLKKNVERSQAASKRIMSTKEQQSDEPLEINTTKQADRPQKLHRLVEAKFTLKQMQSQRVT